MEKKQLHDLIYQAIESERSCARVYEMALRCVQNERLKKEWQSYLGHTRQHAQVAIELCQTLGIDPDVETAGRTFSKHIGECLTKAMEAALDSRDRVAAEVVAAECIVMAETRNFHNWDLIGEAAGKARNGESRALKTAYDAVESEQHEHLYLGQGWSRELWIQHLGMPAVIPPPEKEKAVKTAIGAARARQARAELL